MRFYLSLSLLLTTAGIVSSAAIPIVPHSPSSVHLVRRTDHLFGHPSVSATKPHDHAASHRQLDREASGHKVMANHWQQVQDIHATALHNTGTVTGMGPSHQAAKKAHDNADEQKRKENQLHAAKQSQAWAHHHAANGQQTTAVDREAETRRLMSLSHKDPTFNGGPHPLPNVRPGSPPPHTVPPKDSTTANFPRPPARKETKLESSQHQLTGPRDPPPSQPRPPRQPTELERPPKQQLTGPRDPKKPKKRGLTL